MVGDAVCLVRQGNDGRMIDFAIWTFVVIAGICAMLLVHLIRRSEELAIILEAQI